MEISADGMARPAMDERIAIVGAGFIGRAWAIVFARAGCRVAVYDDSPAALAGCQVLLAENLRDLDRHGLLGDSPEAVLARIVPCATLAEALDGAALVQENARETLEVKRALFAGMDALAPPDAVLASSTSWLTASEFSADLPGRARVMVGHPVNPPHVVPLVEIVPAPWTSAGAVERARDLYARAGQVPVILKKEITGFLLNRIQGAVLNEALNLYAEGYASAEDLDAVVKHGLGLRWSFMGPFETIDLNAPAGLLDYAERYGATYRDIALVQKPNDWNVAVLASLEAERRTVLDAGSLAERARWRDNHLMALAAHKRQARLTP